MVTGSNPRHEARVRMRMAGGPVRRKSSLGTEAGERLKHWLDVTSHFELDRFSKRFTAPAPFCMVARTK